MCIFSLSCKKIIIIKEKVYCLRELVLWELMVNNKDLGMNWVGIPSVAINIPLEGSLLNFFCFYCGGNPVLQRDTTISMHQSSGLLLDGGVRRSDGLRHPDPASRLRSPEDFRPVCLVFWRGNARVPSAA